MEPRRTALTMETFRFFSELGRNNSKAWMDSNRDRYQQHVVGPLRDLLDALTPDALKLGGGFVITGNTGVNFSRINRDIRFAKDKTPYHTRMYLKFPDAADGEGSMLYVGVTADVVTAGFRIYAGANVKTSPLWKYGIARAVANPAWINAQKRKLGKKFETYWHATEKGEWTKHAGWPSSAEQWKMVRAWIVRRKFTTAAALKPSFIKEVASVFRDVAPLCGFASGPNWKP